MDNKIKKAIKDENINKRIDNERIINYFNNKDGKIKIIDITNKKFRKEKIVDIVQIQKNNKDFITFREKSQTNKFFGIEGLLELKNNFNIKQQNSINQRNKYKNKLYLILLLVSIYFMISILFVQRLLIKNIIFLEIDNSKVSLQLRIRGNITISKTFRNFENNFILNNNIFEQYKWSSLDNLERIILEKLSKIKRNIYNNKNNKIQNNIYKLIIIFFCLVNYIIKNNNWQRDKKRFKTKNESLVGNNIKNKKILWVKKINNGNILKYNTRNNNIIENAIKLKQYIIIIIIILLKDLFIHESICVDNNFIILNIKGIGDKNIWN